ncbi:MAG: T9SS type A sorting domain-containing protein [Saprospiraceae bacterium]|nr:T9SS type A sorting domain-containing protein [Saprospiraceae bacterium]
MKIIKHLCLVLSLALVVHTSALAQYFQATMTTDGSSLVFKIKPTGGNITAVFANMEFYIRYPDTKTLTWASPVAKVTDIPGGVIQKNDPYTTITEAGYTIVRFYLPPGTFTTSKTYVNETEYEVFRTTVTGLNSTTIEMMHRNDYTPYYLAIDSETDDVTGSVKFYGSGYRNEGTVQALSLDIVLPVELLDFKGQVESQANLLQWATAKEDEASHFVIEKSIGQSQKFVAIGEQKANNGSTPQYYSFSDMHPSSLDYYRLKMVDKKGQFAYSKTIALTRASKVAIDYFPNPATNNVTIQVSAEKSKDIGVKLFDMTGKLIASQTKDGFNSFDKAVFVFDTQHLPNGIYSAAVVVDGHLSHHKIIVSK